MKKLIITLFAFATLIVSCSKESITGSGNTITETRTVPYFNKVQLNGSRNVTIIYAPNQLVAVEGYENLVPLYETYVSNQTLYLEFDDQVNRVKNNNINIKIEMPAIEGLTINGSGKGSINGNFQTQNILDLFVNGSGNISTGNFQLNNLIARVNGSGDIRTNALANNADVKVTGSGSISLVSLNDLKAVVDGSGKIEYAGNPLNVQTHISGSGRIIRR